MERAVGLAFFDDDFHRAFAHVFDRHQAEADLLAQTVKILSLPLTSGGRTAMWWLRHSSMYLTTPSMECISLVSRAAMNSTGKWALR